MVLHILHCDEFLRKFQNVENRMPRTHTYDQLTSTNAFSHLPLDNLDIFDQFVNQASQCNVLRDIKKQAQKLCIAA